MSAARSYQRHAFGGAARHLKTVLMLATPIVLPVVGAAMLLYGWTTP